MNQKTERRALVSRPCVVCGEVRLLDRNQDGFLGATCACGETQGAQERWDVRDLIERGEKFLPLSEIKVRNLRRLGKGGA